MPLLGLDQVVDEALTVADRFRDAGHRVFLVGGVIRDLYLDRPLAMTPDIDLSTDAEPTQIKAVLGPVADALWTQGERFGTIGAKVGDRVIEITTFRSESYTEASRKPTVRFATEIETDLSRRDFTVNAMAVELPALELVDPFGGAQDLDAGILRTPLDPSVSFADDPLRMLRAARFRAGYDLIPVPELIRAMTAMCDRLAIVSAERIRDELDKLLALPTAEPGLELLATTGLLQQVLPELAGAVPNLDRLRPDPVLRLAAMVATLDDDILSRRLVALRHSKERQVVTRQLVRAARELIDGPPATTTDLRRWVHRVGLDRIDDIVAVAEAVDPAKGAEHGASLGELVEQHRADLTDLEVPLTGTDVMELLAVGPGPRVGRMLGRLQELRYERGPLSKAQAKAALLELGADR